MGLADRVKALRNEQGWSQSELAELVGADPAQISRYENGRITPRPTPWPAWPRPSACRATTCS